MKGIELVTVNRYRTKDGKEFKDMEDATWQARELALREYFNNFAYLEQNELDTIVERITMNWDDLAQLMNDYS